MKAKWFAPTLNILAALILLIAINALFGFARFRFDLTADRSYTLSKGTREILSKIGTPVQVRIYAGASDGALPPMMKNFVRRTEELIKEMAQASGGKLEVQVLDPQPDSDAEDSARLDGIEPQMLPNGETITLGISFSSLDRKSVMPFLTPERERLLEYDIARAISQVQADTRPVLGIMSPLPIMGNPMAMMMGRQGPPPWMLSEELRRDFDIREVPMTSEEIPADIQLLFVIHPKNISPAAEYALDQFLLRGGRLVIFLDPYCIFDGGFGPMMAQPTSSNLPTLLPAWGLNFDSSQAVADLTFEGRTREGRAPWLLELNRTVLNPNDPLTADLDSLMLAFAGAFTGNATEGLTQEILFTSSEDSQLVDPFLARTSAEAVIREFAPSGTKMPLAIRLSGKFKTAFPNGRPNASENSEAGANSAQSPEGLKESAVESSVLLVGDADMIQDPISVTEVRGLFPGGRMFVPINGNLAFAQAAAEQLSGDSSLISVRGRAVGRRPFLVIRELQAEAEKKFQATIRELEASLQETQNRLSELERGKQEGQKFLLTAEQQKEIEKFRATEAEVKARLKATRRELRSEIDALEVRLKWLNIAAVPALVAVFGLGFGIWRRRHSRAR